MIQVTMQFDTMQALHDFTAQFAGGVAVGADLANTAPQLEKKKPGRKPAAPAVVEPDPLMPATAASGAPAPQITIDDVRAILMSYNSKFGLQALSKKLEEVAGVKSMKGLKTSQYAEVHKAFTDALAG